MTGQVWPVIPLALLQAVRDQDRPGEILEAEDLSASLPRRLGLSAVIHTQIRRYEAAVASRANVPIPELSSLMQLVLRRPDGESIVREAGRRVMRQRFGNRAPFAARLLRRSSRLVFVPIRRAVRRLLRGMVGTARAEIVGKPLVVRIDPAFTAQIGASACALYTGAIEELVRVFADRPLGVEHHQCAARGDGACLWRVDVG